MSNYSFCYMLTTAELKFVYVSESVTDVLGFEVRDLVERTTIAELLDPVESDLAIATIRDTAAKNKAACLLYLQLLHRSGGFVDCVMAHSAVNNGQVIVGSISLVLPGDDGAIERDGSAEEYVRIADPSNSRRILWPMAQPPRTALLLDRFSANCTITHCTNNAILNTETCVHHPGGILRYVAHRDEQAIRAFITGLKRSGIGAGSGGFLYKKFTMCTDGRDLHEHSEPEYPRHDEVAVNTVGSATSDALILIVKLDR